MPRRTCAAGTTRRSTGCPRNSLFVDAAQDGGHALAVRPLQRRVTRAQALLIGSQSSSSYCAAEGAGCT